VIHSRKIETNCIILTVTSLLLSLTLCHSQTLHLDTVYQDFELIDANKGLSAGYTVGIVEDTLGYLWIGSRSGLNRYDGINIKNYYHNPDDKYSIPHNIIYSLFCDSNNRVWLKNYNGGGSIYNPLNESFLPVESHVNYSSVIDQKGFIWTYYNGQLQISNQDDYFIENDTLKIEAKDIKKIKIDPEKINPITVTFAKRTFSIHDSKLISLSKENLNIYSINYETLEFQDSVNINLPFKVDAKAYKGGAFIIDKKQNLVYVFGPEKTIAYSLLNGEIKRQIRYPRNIQLKVPKLIDKYQRIWVYGTENNKDFKLYQLLPELNILRDVRILKSPEKNLLSMADIDLFEDSNNNIYTNSNGDGCIKINISRERFNYAGNNHEGPTGQILKTISGEVLFKGGYKVFQVDKALEKLNLIFDPLKIKPSLKLPIYTFQENSGEYTMLANGPSKSQAERYVIHDFERLELKCRYENNLNNSIWHYRYLFQNKDSIWGIDHTDLDSDSLIIFGRSHFSKEGPLFKDSLKLNHKAGIYRAHCKSKNGDVWLGTTSGGLIRYNIYTHRKKNYTVEKGKNSIPSNFILSFLSDPIYPDSILWIGTDNGLSKMLIKEEKFINFNIKSGLPNNVIYGILPDHENNLWLSTNKGLSFMDMDSYTFRNYTFEDGLQHNEFNKFGSAKDSDGDLYFAGMGGLTYFNPEDFYNLTNDANVVINGLKIFNENILYHRNDTILSKNKFRICQPLEYTNQLTFGYDERMITFQFAILDLTNPQKNKYRYKLNGLTDDWINLGNKMEVTLANLSPGQYTFTVQGANHDGIWSQNTDSIQFEVKGPWWQKLWVQLICVLLILLLMYAFFRYRDKQKGKLESLRNRISRDLHDEIGSTLSSIGLFSTVAKKHVKKENTVLDNLLEQIGKSSSEVIESMNDIVWTISTKNDKVEDVISRMRAYAYEMTEASGWELIFNNEKLNLDTTIDVIRRRNIYLIFKEAVNNAIKYSNGHTLTINIHANTNKFNMNIHDDGKEFDSTNTISSHSLSGNGIPNMNIRAKEINGKFDIDSNKDSGTTIKLECPLR